MFVWTNVLKVHKLVVKLTNVEKVYSYVVKLTNVYKTCDLTAQWTENVSKYKIEQLSVSLTCENFKYNIKFMNALKVYIVHKHGFHMKSAYLNWEISNIIWGLWVNLKVYICINMVFVWTNILKAYKVGVKLTNVRKTWDLTAQWIKFVSKYKIELNLCT